MRHIFSNGRRMANSVISHSYFSGAILLCAFILFAIQPGGLLDMMRLAGILYLVLLFSKNYGPRHFTAGHLILLIIVTVLVANNWFLDAEKIHSKSVGMLIAFPGIVLLIHAFVTTVNDEQTRLFSRIFIVAASSCSLIQLLGVFLIGDQNLAGFYSNIHHQGLFAGLTLPIFLLFLLISSGWYRLAAGSAALADLYLLALSGSKASWLAIILSLSLTFLSFIRKSHLIIAAVVIAAFIIGMAVSPYSIRTNNRVANLIINIKSDKRWVIWTDTVEMLKTNTPKEWCIGRGVGSFRFYFPKSDGKSSYRIRNNVNFPHNMLLQLLFENGLFGLLLVLGGAVFIPLALRSTYYRTRSASHRQLALVLFYSFFCVMAQCLFTKSVYSKYFLFSLGVIIGMSFYLFEPVGLNASVYDLLQRYGAQFKYPFFKKR